MSVDQEGVDIRPLLEALQRRGAGQPHDPVIGGLETLRTCTEWTGEVFPQQLTNLKRSAMLIMNQDKIILGIDVDNKQVHYVFGGPEEKIVDARMQGLVFQVLGRGWSCIRDAILKPDDLRPTPGPGRRSPGRKRIRSRKKARKR